MRLEKALAGMLLKHVHFLQDARGIDANLHYIRTKDGAEIDFCMSKGVELTHLIECKLTDTTPHAALRRFAKQFPANQAFQLVRNLRQPEFLDAIHIEPVAKWLGGLSASAGQ